MAEAFQWLTNGSIYVNISVNVIHKQHTRPIPFTGIYILTTLKPFVYSFVTKIMYCKNIFNAQLVENEKIISWLGNR